LAKNEHLHVSGSSSTHHQEFVNCTFGNGIRYTVAKCTVNELLMMGRGTARNIYRFIF